MAGPTRDWDIPSSWAPALEAARAGSVMLLLGGVDSGKTTLAAVLANAAQEAGRATAVVDADVGQSSVGPPACVGMAVVDRPVSGLDELAAQAIDFVGSPSPAGHLLQCATSAAVMVRAARALGAETLIVDTTGLIAGPFARALKGAKMRLLEPDVVVALQAEDEAEHLLTPSARRSRPRVLRLPRSRKVKPRDREERTSRRQRAFAAYFAAGRAHDVEWASLPMENTAWTTGEPAPGHVAAYAEEVLGCEVLHAEWRAGGIFVIVRGRPDAEGLRRLGEGFGGQARACEASCLEKRLIGLLGDAGETLGLGILEAIDFRRRRVIIFSPLPDLARARAGRLGAIQLSRDGTQLAWNEPGDTG